MAESGSDKVHFVVGTYARLGGAGLVPLTLDGDRLTVGAAIGDVEDASHGLWSRRHDCLYAVAEQPAGAVRALRLEGGRLRPMASAATQGEAPCHVALDPAERMLAVANYESGSVALYRLAPDGALPPVVTAHHQLTGRGPNQERQAGPHAHWVGFDRWGTRLYCVDLGADRILAFPVDGQHAPLGEPVVAYQAPPGSGPRHLAFHPTRPLALLVSELASTLTQLIVQPDGALTAVETVSTVPPGTGDSLGGAIVLAPSGTYAYVTNRGHDSIAVFALGADGPMLVQTVPSGGASPRFLLLLENQARLLVANEEGGTVAQFAISEDGTLAPVGAPVAVAGAVLILPATP